MEQPIVIAAHNNANGTHPGAAIASLKIGSTEIYTDENWRFSTELLGSYAFSNSLDTFLWKRVVNMVMLIRQSGGIVHHVAYLTIK